VKLVFVVFAIATVKETDSDTLITSRLFGVTPIVTTGGGGGGGSTIEEP
jgi:hypothetical protein